MLKVISAANLQRSSTSHRSKFHFFRAMPISVPGMPITGSGLMAITIPG